MRITAIRETKRGRFSVYDENGFVTVLHPDVYYRSAIAAGDCIDDARFAEILAESDRMTAKQKALSLLAGRDYTAQQMYDKLRETVDEQIAAETVARMQELHLICDENYAEQLAHDLCRVKGYGPTRIRNELQKRGIDRELAERTVEDLEIDETAQAIEILRRKGYRLDDPRERNRAVGALLRQGYGYDGIRQAIEQIRDEELTDED